MTKLLQLPSLRQLIDRLLHLLAFNTPFIFLSGKPSSGAQCKSLRGKLPGHPRVVQLIGALWAFCRHNDTLNSSHKLAIVPSGNDGWCRSQQAQLKGRAMSALELELAPLSAPEQRIFLYEKAKEFKIPAALLPQRKVDATLNAANGHPSVIM